MYSVGQGIHCYNIITNLLVKRNNHCRGRGEDFKFCLFSNRGCAGEWNGAMPSFGIKPSCAAVFTKPNRFICKYINSEKFNGI